MGTIGLISRRAHRDRAGRGRARRIALVAGLVLAVVSSVSPAALATGSVVPVSPAAPGTGSVVPGPPQNVWLESDLEIVTVYLDANPDGLAVEHLVRLETVPADPATTQERRVPPSSGAWFEGLELGRTYAVQVWAVGADGTLSEPVVPVGSPFTFGAPPLESLLEVTATAPAPDTIEVTWVPNPEAPPPQAFVVIIQKDPDPFGYLDRHIEEGIPGTTRSFTWSDAEPAATYYVTVAVSDPQSPVPSRYTTVTTPEAGPPPPAPLAVTATVAGTTMTVAWTPDNTGPAAERYRVRASSEQCESVGTWAAGTSTSTDLVVRRDCEYEVTVAALAPDGASSTPVEAAGSPVYVPFEPPFDVEAVAISAHQVVVRWQTDAPPDQLFWVRVWTPESPYPRTWTTQGTEVTTGWWEAGSSLVVRVASCSPATARCGPWIPETGVSVTLPADVSTLSGVVTAPDGTPLAGAAVWAYASADAWLPSATATTGADGSYALVDVPPSSYTIRVNPPAGSPLAPHWYPGTPSRSEATSVWAEGGRTYSDLDVAFAAPRSVTGRVTREGVPVAGAIVMAFTPADTWLGSFRATTAGDGTYTLDGLAAASTYKILVLGPEGSGLEARWYPGTGHLAEATPVDTTAGPVTDIDIDWPAAPGISGVVTGPHGLPLAGATVAAYRPTDRYVGTVAVISAADGSYSLDRLDPGTYLLFVRPRAGSGVAACWHAGVLQRADATPVTFTGAPRTGIDTACPAG